MSAGSVLAAAGNHLHETVAAVAADDDHVAVLIHLHLAGVQEAVKDGGCTLVSLCVGGDYFQLFLHSLELLVLELGFLQALLLESMLTKYFILRPSPFGAHLQEHRANAFGFYREHN